MKKLNRTVFAFFIGAVFASIGVGGSFRFRLPAGAYLMSNQKKHDESVKTSTVVVKGLSTINPSDNFVS